jgi:regulator of protease activity HflC (stomatin/prohibitin superfamily)
MLTYSSLFLCIVVGISFCTGAIVATISKITLLGVVFGIGTFALIMYECVNVINAPKAAYVMLLGKPIREIKAGIHFLMWPFEHLHNFKWKRREENSRGDSVLAHYKGNSISTAEMIFDVIPYKVVTKDGMEIVVNLIVHYRITNLGKAFFDIADPFHSMEECIITSIRDVATELSLEEAVNNKKPFENSVKNSLKHTQDKWGIEITQVDIQNIKQPYEIASATLATLTEKRKAAEEYIRQESVHNFALKKIEMDQIEELNRMESMSVRKRESIQRDHELEMMSLETEMARKLQNAKYKQDLQNMENEKKLSIAKTETEMKRLAEEAVIKAKIKEIEGLKKAGLEDSTLSNYFHMETMKILGGKNVQFLPQSALDMLGATTLYRSLPNLS